MIKTPKSLLTTALSAIMVISLFAPAAIASDQARATIETMIDRELKRSEGTDAFVVQETNNLGHTNFIMYEKVNSQTIFQVPVSGEIMYLDSDFLGYRVVLPDEIQLRLTEKYGGETGAVFPEALRKETLSAGENLWTGSSLEPDSLVFESLRRVNEAATNTVEGVAMYEQDPLQQHRADLRAFGDLASFHVVNEDDGEFVVLIANDLSIKEKTEDGTYTINSIALYLDENYVQRKLRMSGTSKLKKTGENPFEIAMDSNAYKTVSGSKLYIPFERVMGVNLASVNEDELNELGDQKEELKKQLAEMEKQLAALPPEQKAMAKKMMAPLKKQLEGLMKEEDGTKGTHIVGSDTTVDQVCLGGIETWVIMVTEHKGMPANPLFTGPAIQCTKG